MENTVRLNEEQLRNAIRKTIESALLEEGIDEVNWLQRAGQGLRNGFDNLKTNIGGAMAGAKAGLKYGGINAARAGANDYKAQRNADLATSRKGEADKAIENFRQEYRKKVGELNSWKASEIRQIKQMYGADAFKAKANTAQGNAMAARDDQAQFWGYQNGQAQNVSNGQYKKAVEESVEKIDNIVAEELKKYIG